MANQPQVQSSAPISLPKSHIQRTPSEQQLAADTERSRYQDLDMYSRILTGMTSQIHHSQSLSPGKDVHPLSAKSIRGIIKTRYTTDHELEQYGREEHDDGPYLIR